ncbi:hypothetical protein [Rathayibacter rathayi]|uniref:hypothetical protein n=1 Tax=Rathayibacter rathayi TaxID=33887 RepID=UPI000BDCC948|nr:hypothetical protein [Rathayibacter rathayi]SOE06008.1 hypothetical protein SAMN06295924_12215 [Rathayibacter rathayi NCPPB 2980 = VKM Ac-1601]
MSVRNTASLVAFRVFSAASAALGVAEIYTSREVAEAGEASTVAAQAQAPRDTEQEATEQAACLSQTQRNASAISLDAVNLTAATTGMVGPAIVAANNDGYLASIATAGAPRPSSGSNSSNSGSTDATGSSTGGSTSGSTGSTNGTSTSAAPAGSSSSSSGTTDTETGSSPSDAGSGGGAPTPASTPSFTTAHADAAIAGICGGNVYRGIAARSTPAPLPTAGSVVRAATSLIGGGASVGWSVSVSGGTASVQYYACY